MPDSPSKFLIEMSNASSIANSKEYYSKESVQWEIIAGNRTGTVEQMDVNVEVMARDLQEILRIGAEQKRLSSPQRQNLSLSTRAAPSVR